MKLERIIEILEKHQEWRRDQNVPPTTEMQSPIEIGTAIDYALSELKKLRLGVVSKRCSVALKCVYSPDGKNCGMSKCVSSEFDKRPIHITDDGEWIGGNKDFYNK